MQCSTSWVQCLCRKNEEISMKHLKDNKMSYPQHWWRAMSMSIALFIHAWFPNVLASYASDKMDMD